MTQNKRLLTIVLAGGALSLVWIGTSHAGAENHPIPSATATLVAQNHNATEQGAKEHSHHENGAEEHSRDVVRVHDLEISTAWTRATVSSAQVGGGYITIHNKGDAADRLIAAVADFAKEVQFHQMTLVGDVMRMRPVEGHIEIPAGGSVIFKPGAEHLMFIGLERALVEGEVVNVKLTFEKAGEVSVAFKVHNLAARGSATHQPHKGHGN